MAGVAGQYLGALPAIGSLELQYLLGISAMAVTAGALLTEPGTSRGRAPKIRVGAAAIMLAACLLAVAGAAGMLEVGFIVGQGIALLWAITAITILWRRRAHRPNVRSPG